jgi:hypothetical protein
MLGEKKEDFVDLHGDGRWSNLEKFNLKKLRGLGYWAVSSIIVAGNLERALWFGHDFDLVYRLLVVVELRGTAAAKTVGMAQRVSACTRVGFIDSWLKCSVYVM